ncbi:hypothetical protein CULT_510004 [[Clostridium] ultunense Esp]|nr:hypothetical protein CULT_510004 [[Clostridium] ultunense Esp]
MPEEERVCSCCGGSLHEISTKVRTPIVIFYWLEFSMKKERKKDQ